MLGQCYPEISSIFAVVTAEIELLTSSNPNSITCSISAFVGPAHILQPKFDGMWGRVQLLQGRCENQSPHIIQPTLPSVQVQTLTTLLMQPDLTVNWMSWLEEFSFCSVGAKIELLTSSSPNHITFPTSSVVGAAHILQPKCNVMLGRVQMQQG